LKVATYTDQWDAQATVKRINESLIERGYVTWFDLTNMKGIASALPGASGALLLLLCSSVVLQLIDLMPTGADAGSTVDAMSDAIEGADVMLYGVSLAYKESANVSAMSDLSLPVVCPLLFATHLI
jgi:hypothetical protein